MRKALLVVGAVLILAVLWLVAFPRPTPRIINNQHSAAKILASILDAQRTYASAENRGGGYACSLDELGRANMIDPLTAAGSRSGYSFELSCSALAGPGHFNLAAVPTNSGVSGKRAFCADESFQVWYSDSGSAAGCLHERHALR